jgi:hypothetical protein
MMGQTAKYCEDCQKKLTQADTTTKEKEFFRARFVYRRAHS